MLFNKKILLLFTLLSAIVLFYSFDNYLKKEKKMQVELIIDEHLNDLTDFTHKKKDLLLTAAVLLSKDKKIHECIKTNIKSHCEEELIISQETLLNSKLFENMKIHLHDNKLRSFLRLWEKGKQKNDSLINFRDSLHIVKNSKKPISGIEIGRYSMLLRAISPIYKENKYLGSIEVISDFKPIIKYFEDKNVKLYILMKKEFEKIASSINFKKEQKLDKYILLNETNEDLTFVNDLNLDYSSYIEKDSRYILFTPIFDFNTNIIGYYMLDIPFSKF